MKKKHKMNIKTQEDQLRPGNNLEYFFYATNRDCAEDLMRDLLLLNYSVGISDVADSHIFFLIYGCTSTYISDGNQHAWIKKMNRLAKKHNCIFDGWGSQLSM
jgi:hypothetical protein